MLRAIAVRGVSNARGPPPVAQALYEETPESVAAGKRPPASGGENARARPGHRTRPPEPSATRRQLADWDRWSARPTPTEFPRINS